MGGNGGTSAITSEAAAVSGNGNVVVGSSLIDDPVRLAYHAFPWQDGIMIDLGTLGSSGPHDGSRAFDVSDNGQVVVGVANIENGDCHAFRWQASTGMADLGTLGGGSAAWGVNGNGSVVVGDSISASGATHAFRWTKSSGMTDLGTLGGDFARAYWRCRHRWVGWGLVLATG